MTENLVIGTSYLVLQRKLLYFALSTSYFGESCSFGESRYGDGRFVKKLVGSYLSDRPLYAEMGQKQRRKRPMVRNYQRNHNGVKGSKEISYRLLID